VNRAKALPFGSVLLVRAKPRESWPMRGLDSSSTSRESRVSQRAARDPALLKKALRSMSFLSAEPTPFDLHFRMFGVDVRVHPFFWLFMALLGWNGDNLQYTFIWVMCGFLSILAHELGHALTSRFFGQPSDITLYAFGGYATAYPFHGTWRNVAVVAAGPLVSFSTGGLAYLAMLGLFRFPQWLPEDEQVVGNILYFLFCLQFQGIGWGLLNSIPIYPLDGGQITRYLFVRFRPWDGVSLSLKLSLLLAIIFGVLAFQRQDTMWGIFMLSFAMNNWQELQMARG
jgi:stage IV sporulation protein FB